MASDRRGARIALALLGFAAALGLSELVLRAREPRVPHGLRGLHQVRPDRPWLYGLRPGARATLSASGDVAYAINQDGFRDRRYARPRPPDAFRILILGDSVTFGYGVAEGETYPTRIESLLGAGFEVLNFGVGGYNPYNEAALFADVGVSYEPDLVLVQFCTNDLNDPTLHFDAQTRQHLGELPDEAFPDPAARRSAAPPRPLSALGCRSLRLCARMDELLVRWRDATRDREESLAALRSLDALPEGAPRAWLARHYGAIADAAARIGAGFAVLAFPFRAQVEGGASARLQQQLVALGAEDGWETVDLLPAFQAARAAGAEPLFLDVWHPSAAGHRLAARAIVEALAQRGLLPEARRGPRRPRARAVSRRRAKLDG